LQQRYDASRVQVPKPPPEHVVDRERITAGCCLLLLTAALQRHRRSMMQLLALAQGLAAAALLAGGADAASVRPAFGEASGNRSDHINPTHYGSPLDSADGSPPINCRLDEDGLILDSFVYVPATGKMTQVEYMWCAPNVTRTGGKCPADAPPGATTKGAKPMRCGGEGDFSCFLSCTRDSDCGPSGHPTGKYKAVCAPETNRTVNGTFVPGALPANMCSWHL
jgi:hypothetical protein